MPFPFSGSLPIVRSDFFELIELAGERIRDLFDLLDLSLVTKPMQDHVTDQHPIVQGLPRLGGR